VISTLRLVKEYPQLSDPVLLRWKIHEGEDRNYSHGL
jgi:hypothetical protein